MTNQDPQSSVHELPLGQVLGLPGNNHFYQLPVLCPDPDQLEQASFLLAFGQAEAVQFVSHLTSAGVSPSLDLATRVSKDQLYASLSVVPLTQMTSLVILALPLDRPSHLTSLHQLYPDLPLLQLSYAQEREGQEQDLDYDPYRYTARTDKQEQASQSWSLNWLDRDYEAELSAFAKDRQGRPKQISLSYWDSKKQIQTRIFVRGWYFFDNQPPLQISWRPSHKRNSRWRTSHVFIDKANQHLFFEGELYRGKQAPIFLKDLSFSAQPTERLKQAWQDFLTLAQQLGKTKD